MESPLHRLFNGEFISLFLSQLDDIKLSLVDNGPGSSFVGLSTLYYFELPTTTSDSHESSAYDFLFRTSGSRTLRPRRPEHLNG